MSSLPFISHHLFVAAVRHEGRALRKPSQDTTPARGVDSRATEAQLELLSGARSMPANAVRQLRASTVLGGT
jgi:hypothetical protein